MGCATNRRVCCARRPTVARRQSRRASLLEPHSVTNRRDAARLSSPKSEALSKDRMTHEFIGSAPLANGCSDQHRESSTKMFPLRLCASAVASVLVNDSDMTVSTARPIGPKEGSSRRARNGTCQMKTACPSPDVWLKPRPAPEAWARRSATPRSPMRRQRSTRRRCRCRARGRHPGRNSW